MSALARRSVLDLNGFFIYSRPLPYNCIVTPRFPEVQSILVEERESFED